MSEADRDDGNKAHFRIKSDRRYNTTTGYDLVNSRVLSLVSGSEGFASDTLASEPRQIWDTVLQTAGNPIGGNTVELAIYIE